MDLTTFLSEHCAGAGVTLKESLIQQQQADLGVFAVRRLGQGKVVGFYYGSMVYAHLCRRRNTSTTHGQRLMDGTRTSCRNEEITCPRKSWIRITLNTMCGLCLSCFVLRISSPLVGIFLATRL